MDDEIDAIGVDSTHIIEIDPLIPREQIDERYQANCRPKNLRKSVSSILWLADLIDALCTVRCKYLRQMCRCEEPEHPPNYLITRT